MNTTNPYEDLEYIEGVGLVDPNTYLEMGDNL